MTIKTAILKANELRFRQPVKVRGFKMSAPVESMMKEMGTAENLTDTMIVHAAIVALYDVWKNAPAI